MAFWNSVNKVIGDADIILEVLDARYPEMTRHKEIEDKVAKAGKVLIIVLNKSDLIDKETLMSIRKDLPRAIFVSSKDHNGFKTLKERMNIEGKRTGWEKIRVGVVGYPNVGKSTIINTLKGTGSASTSSQSGHTRGVQKLVKRNLIFLDTPGVIPYLEKDANKHAIIGAKDWSKIDAEDAIYEIMNMFPGELQKRYDVNEDDEFLEALALKRNFLKKKGEPDTKRCAKEVMKEWQHGNLGNSN